MPNVGAWLHAFDIAPCLSGAIRRRQTNGLSNKKTPPSGGVNISHKVISNRLTMVSPRQTLSAGFRHFFKLLFLGRTRQRRQRACATGNDLIHAVEVTRAHFTLMTSRAITMLFNRELGLL